MNKLFIILACFAAGTSQAMSERGDIRPLHTVFAAQRAENRYYTNQALAQACAGMGIEFVLRKVASSNDADLPEPIQLVSLITMALASSAVYYFASPEERAQAGVVKTAGVALTSHIAGTLAMSTLFTQHNNS